MFECLILVGGTVLGRITRCGVIKQGVSLLVVVEISKAYTGPSLVLSMSETQGSEVNSQWLLQCAACLSPPHLEGHELTL